MKQFLQETIDFLSVAHMILVGLGLSAIYGFPIPARFIKNLDPMPLVALISGTIGLLKGLKTFSWALLKLLLNKDILWTNENEGIDVVYVLVGSGLVSFVSLYAIYKAFKSKYFPEKKVKGSDSLTDPQGST